MSPHLLLYVFLILLAAGCATNRSATEGPKSTFTRNSVALMIVPTYEDAELLRASLVRGKPLPASAEIIPIQQLFDTSSVLSKAAAGLGECGVSRIISPADSDIGNAYVILQRGSDSGDCQYEGKESQTFSQKVDEKGGEILIGILSIALAAFLVALPFIF